MPKQRNPENTGLPPRWRYRSGTYSYMVPLGDEHQFEGKKEFKLGRDLETAHATWASILNAEEPVRADLDTQAENTVQVYRCYDRWGDLLYVGQSNAALARLRDHETGADWYRRVASITFARYLTRLDAQRAQSIAIRTENPLFNISETDKKKPV